MISLRFIGYGLTAIVVASILYRLTFGRKKKGLHFTIHIVGRNGNNTQFMITESNLTLTASPHFIKSTYGVVASRLKENKIYEMQSPIVGPLQSYGDDFVTLKVVNELDQDIWFSDGSRIYIMSGRTTQTVEHGFHYNFSVVPPRIMPIFPGLSPGRYPV